MFGSTGGNQQQGQPSGSAFGQTGGPGLSGGASSRASRIACSLSLLTCAGQHSASSNPNNSLLPILCLAALVQIPQQRRRPASGLESRASIDSKLILVLSGGAFGQTLSNTASLFCAPKPAAGTGVFGFTGFGSTTGSTTTSMFDQRSTSTAGAFGNTGTFGNEPTFGTSTQPYRSSQSLF